MQKTYHVFCREEGPNRPKKVRSCSLLDRPTTFRSKASQTGLCVIRLAASAQGAASKDGVALRLGSTPEWSERDGARLSLL